MHDYLKKLVEFDTISETGLDTKTCLDWLEQFFSDHFLYTHRVEHGGIESLVATTKPTKTPTILLQAHLDVVPAPAELLKLRTQDDRYTGRGTFDMKFAIAIYMQLVEKLGKKLPEHDFGIMITTDEELGGFNGVEALLKNGFGANVCVIPDGGDNWCIEKSAKGFYLVEATATGKTAHGSRPWEGENAIEKILQFIETVRAIFNDEGPDGDTLTISTIAGGEAMNQVPQTASVQLDIRTQNNTSHRNVADTISKAAELHGVETVMKLSSPPITADLTNTYVKNFIDITESLTKQKITPCTSLGASDARFFEQKNIPTIVMRPRGGGAHSDDEWINRTDIDTYYKVIESFITSNC